MQVHFVSGFNLSDYGFEVLQQMQLLQKKYRCLIETCLKIRLISASSYYQHKCWRHSTKNVFISCTGYWQNEDNLGKRKTVFISLTPGSEKGLQTDQGQIWNHRGKQYFLQLVQLDQCEQFLVSRWTNGSKMLTTMVTASSVLRSSSSACPGIWVKYSFQHYLTHDIYKYKKS